MDTKAAVDLEARVAARIELKEARLRQTRRMATGLLLAVTAVFVVSTAYGRGQTASSISRPALYSPAAQGVEGVVGRH